MKNNNYDLIGDIHGQAPELLKLLAKLSYNNINGIWQHPERKVIFLGDFVDRGSDQKEVIDIVRPMIENGHALSVMGNHEYNAIAYYTINKDGNHLRSHNNKHTKQHQSFLDAYDNTPEEKASVIEWFKTLPLWLDLGNLRVIHACWDFDLIDQLGSNKLTNDVLMKSAIKGSLEYEAIETLLKGKEIPLPEGCSFNDKDGNPRKHIRIQYWLQNAVTYRDYFMGPSSVLDLIPDTPVEGDYLINYSANEKPLFHGHYWLETKIRPLTDNIACVDYSVAKPGGKLVAYRWNGEQTLSKDKFIFVNRVN